MSARSGVFIKYIVEFDVAPGAAGAAGRVAGLVGAVRAAAGAGGSLKVSNDLLAGDVCLDADVSVVMSRGTKGATFKITLYDLPEPNATSLSEMSLSDTPARPATVKINLGYFDTEVQLVLDGIYEKVESKAMNDKLVTTVTGREKAFFACAKTPFTKNLKGDFPYAKAANEVLSSILSNKELPKDCVDGTLQEKAPLPSSPRDKMHNPILHEKNGVALDAFAAIARQAKAEFLIIDRKVFLGSPILYDSDSVAPAPLDYATNLAKFDKFALKISGGNKGTKIKGFNFTVIGDPTMRPGQKIAVKNIEDYNSPEFRIHHVEHNFSASAGYTCVGAATERPANGELAQKIDTALDRSAASAAMDITERVRSQAFENPVVEIASVKSVSDGIMEIDLYYGQPADANETQPSINAAIKVQEDHVFLDKPIASPFAWRKCGLVTPVYLGMKAVVAHNRALSSDAIVTGYIWSKLPDFPPPEHHIGDWWLCLPIDFDSFQPPGDLTKAANDLTTNTGKRVIEVKGLKITVGASKLGRIGKRPDEGLDDEFLIEHASGTSVLIDSNGALTIDASKASLTIKSLTIKGDVVVEGSLEIK